LSEEFGLGTIDHTEPFHDSISVSSKVGPVYPTAVHAEGPVHDTPVSVSAG
jgi:hypothetical protein